MADSQTRCVRCGKPVSPGKIRTSHGICEHCFEALGPVEKNELLPGWSLRHGESEQQIIDGHTLVCPVCGHDRFWKRNTVLLTPAAAFMNFNWGSKAATNYICDQCGYIYWFLREPNK